MGWLPALLIASTTTMPTATDWPRISIGHAAAAAGSMVEIDLHYAGHPDVVAIEFALRVGPGLRVVSTDQCVSEWSVGIKLCHAGNDREVAFAAVNGSLEALPSSRIGSILLGVDSNRFSGKHYVELLPYRTALSDSDAEEPAVELQTDPGWVEVSGRDVVVDPAAGGNGSDSVRPYSISLAAPDWLDVEPNILAVKVADPGSMPQSPAFTATPTGSGPYWTGWHFVKLRDPNPFASDFVKLQQFRTHLAALLDPTDFFVSPLLWDRRPCDGGNARKVTIGDRLRATFFGGDLPQHRQEVYARLGIAGVEELEVQPGFEPGLPPTATVTLRLSQYTGVDLLAFVNAMQDVPEISVARETGAYNRARGCHFSSGGQHPVFRDGFDL